MFTPTPLQRTLEAAIRDLSSAKPAVRASAARDLAVAGFDDPVRAAEALRGALTDEHADVREGALHACGVLRLEPLSDAVLALLADPQSKVRQQALITASELGGDKGLAAIETAFSSEHADVRYQALVALCALAPADAFSRCLELLSDDDPWIASEAAIQLPSLVSAGTPTRGRGPYADAGADRAVTAAERLRARSDSGSERVRVCTAIALARLGDDHGRRVLVAFVSGGLTILGEDQAEIRIAAIETLAQLGGDDARDAIAALAWRVVPSLERAVARAALARLGDERAQGVISAQLRSVWAARREAAVRLAAMAGMRNAVPEIESMFASGRIDPYTAVDAFGAIGGSHARAALERIARGGSQDSDIRAAAREAADRLAHEGPDE